MHQDTVYPGLETRRETRVTRMERNLFIILFTLAVLCSAGYAEGQIGQTNHHVGPSETGRHRITLSPGWKIYRGQGGLVLFHPVGWRIRERTPGAFWAYRPEPDGNASALVLAEPIARIEGRAIGVLQGLERIFPSLFPGLTVSKSRQVWQNPEVAVARLDYAPKGRPFVGTAMCFKTNDRGVIYVMAATARSWSGEEPVMKRMLASVFYSKTGVPTDPAAGPAAGPLPMVTWRDPLENAFTCPIPRGWTASGGLKRLTAIDIRPEILVTSPDRAITVRLGDAWIPPLTLPGPMMRTAGFAEGSWYSPDGLNRQLVMRYRPAIRFLTDYYLPQRIGRIDRVETRDYPQLSQPIQALWAQTGIQARVDTGDVHFETQTSEGLRRGYGFAQTVLHQLPQMPNEGLWFVSRLAGYLATPDTGPTAAAILSQMVSRFQINPTWQAQQNRLTAQVSKTWSDTHHEIMNMIDQTFKERWRAQDRMDERWSRSMRDQVLVEDPSTGERFEVAAGSNYYWRIEGREDFLGAEGPEPVYLPSYWLKEMRIVD